MASASDAVKPRCSAARASTVRSPARSAIIFFKIKRCPTAVSLGRAARPISWLSRQASRRNPKTWPRIVPRPAVRAANFRSALYVMCSGTIKRSAGPRGVSSIRAAISPRHVYVLPLPERPKMISNTFPCPTVFLLPLPAIVIRATLSSSRKIPHLKKHPSFMCASLIFAPVPLFPCLPPK